MKRNVRLVLSVVACLTFMLSLSALSQADNDFSATGKALQDQGFIRPDTGGPVGNNEMALNPGPDSSRDVTIPNPFSEGDALRYGGLFGPLREGGFDAPPLFDDRFLGALLPDTRSMGFDRDPDHFIPITRRTTVD